MSDENLRRLERAHLAALEDRDTLGRYAAALGRSMGSADDAAAALEDLWARSEIEADNDDFDAVTTGLAGVHGWERAIAATNAMATRHELVNVDEDDRDQDQRSPEWRARRFHPVNFDFGRVSEGGSFYSPLAKALVGVQSEVEIGTSDGFVVRLMTDVTFPRSGDLPTMIAEWAPESVAGLSAWALNRVLLAVRRMIASAVVGRVRNLTVVCPERAILSTPAGRGRRRQDPLQALVDRLMPGASAIPGEQLSWRLAGLRLDVVTTDTHGEARNRVMQILAGRHAITPYPFRVRLEELRARHHAERDNESVTLEHVPSDMIVEDWRGDETFDGEEESGRTVVGSLVEDGFLDPQDWTTSAAHYAHEHHLISVEDFDARLPQIGVPSLHDSGYAVIHGGTSDSATGSGGSLTLIPGSPDECRICDGRGCAACDPGEGDD